MYEKLPQELKERSLFCLWKYEEREDGLTTLTCNSQKAEFDIDLSAYELNIIIGSPLIMNQ